METIQEVKTFSLHFSNIDSQCNLTARFLWFWD